MAFPKFQWLDEIALNQATSHVAFRVGYLIVCKYRNESKGFAFVGLDTLASDLGVNEKTIRRAIEELKAVGCLHVRHQKNKSNIYTPISPQDRTQMSEPDRTHMSDQEDAGSDIFDARVGHSQGHRCPTNPPEPTSEPALHGRGPETAFSIVVGSTAELLQAMGEDRIDTALCAGDPVGSEDVARFPMAWFGASELLADEVLPLVSISPPCPFLKAAQQALDAMGRPWRISLATPSLDGLRAAVEAGLGVACRTVAGMGLPPLLETSLPPLPSIQYTVIERRRGKEGPAQVAVRMTAHLASLAATSE